MKFGKIVGGILGETESGLSAQPGSPNSVLGTDPKVGGIDNSQVPDVLGTKKKRPTHPAMRIVPRSNRKALKENTEISYMVPQIDSFILQVNNLTQKLSQIKKVNDPKKLDKDSHKRFSDDIDNIIAMLNSLKVNDFIKTMSQLKGEETLSPKL